jgi:hypothetical protein
MDQPSKKGELMLPDTDGMESLSSKTQALSQELRSYAVEICGIVEKKAISLSGSPTPADTVDKPQDGDSCIFGEIIVNINFALDALRRIRDEVGRI